MDNVIQAQEKFSLFDHVPLGVCILQSDLVVLFWNCCLEEWTQIPKSKILGTKISEHFPHFNQPKYINRLLQIFSGGSPTVFSSQLHQYIIPAPLPQGRYRIQHTTVTSVPALDGVGFYAILSLQDVTDLTFRVQEYRTMRDRALAEAQERQRAQQTAEAANRIKDEFLAVLSHELRTPLSPILGWVKLLKQQKLDEASTLRAIENIERNAELQVRLIEDLLDISCILRGKVSLNWQGIDLKLIIYAALETVSLAAEAKSIHINLKLDKHVGLVCGDANRLQQIVWNLLSNSVKFTPTDGLVEVSLEQIDSQVKIRVSDTGKGISPEFLPYVFESFRQADTGTTRKFGGLGLGLSIVRYLIELHGGTVTADSPGEGQGATFSVSLPLMKQRVGQGERQTTQDEENFPTSSLAGIRILIVEDEADTRDFLVFLLQEYGAKVTATTSAVEALATISECQPDLLLSDLGMPGVDGYNLIQQLRAMPEEQGGNIPAIALTAYAAETTQKRVLAAGFQRHIAKPVEPMELISAIVEVIKSNNLSRLG
ncbi:MAG: response regulator [Stigonema ocellatum SAG 48.90 = DSM 106950]|nr:response regulator [Stigonema ocellatum SAG 48.90 = DSM 106950]